MNKRLVFGMRAALVISLSAIEISIGGCGWSANPMTAVDLNTAPLESELNSISYMHRDEIGFDRLTEAKSCKDFELALRWNHYRLRNGKEQRPEFLRATAKFGDGGDLIRQDLNQTVFFTGTITHFAEDAFGAVWHFETADGNILRGIMPKEFVSTTLKNDERDPRRPHFIKPIVAGRAICGVGTRVENNLSDAPTILITIAIDRDS